MLSTCEGVTMKRKSMLPTPEDLTLDEIQSRFGTDKKARQYLEEIRWPNGVVCPHCQNADPKRIWEIKASAQGNIRPGLRQCAECKKQFTVTVGTIFEDSHIPLRKWLVAWYLLCASKKGISSLQIQRMLGLGSYRTALFMMHRIRYALSHPAFTKGMMLKGVVEVDETYVGGKNGRPGKEQAWQ
jgi:transposase-like protein